MVPSARSSSRYKLTSFIEEHIHALDKPKSEIPFIIITESWLKPFISDAQITIPDYEIVRQDRIKRLRGGVILYVHKSLPISDICKYDDDTCEAVICTIKTINTKIAAVYRPPDTSDNSFENLLSFLDKGITNLFHPNRHMDIIMAGDFNFPDINWLTSHIHIGNKLTTNSEDQLLRFMEKHFLSQYVNQPTRERNILDLLLTNNDNLVLHTSSEETTLSDHNIVKVHTTYNIQSKKTTAPPSIPTHSFRSLNLYKADFEKINAHLETIQWDDLKKLCSPEEFPELLRLTVLQVCTLYAPPKIPPRKQSNPFVRDRIILRRRKRKVKNQIRVKNRINPNSNKLMTLRAELYDLNTKIKESIEQQELEKETKVLEKIQENPRYFYSYAKRFSKRPSTIGPLLNDKNELEADPKKMADLLQQQYSSVFSDPKCENKKCPNQKIEIKSTLSDIVFTEKDIIKAIDEIHLDSACGEDDIPSRILKKCKNNLSYPILILWKESFKNGFIAKQYKTQIITPVHKKDSKAEAANYRPISLTSHIIKIFERIIRNHIVSHLEINNLICCNQHGFRKNRSCLTQLLHHIDTILKNFLRNQDTDVIYLDFAKAFDKVDHEILLKKLFTYGIRGKLLTWLHSYLKNREQTVVINGKHSFPARVESGVPQGTVLGPILFIIYLNDIEKCVKHSVLSSFADDTRLKRSINTTNDVALLQSDLSKTIDWSVENNMLLHQKKFELVCHTLNQHNYLKHLPFYSEHSEYHTADGTIITPQNTVKDLGVIISSDLSWSPHIKTVTESAKKIASWILSVFADRRAEILLPLYKSLVRSRPEYCSPLFTTSKQEDIKLLESTQRSFTAHIKEVKHLDYWQRLEKLKLMSVERRRERYCIIFVYKILHQLAPNDLNFEFYESTRHGIRCTIPPLVKNSSTKAQSLYDDSFRVKGAKLFNIIPKHIRQKQTLNSFKSTLTKFLLKLEDHPPVPGIASQNSLLFKLASLGAVEEDGGMGSDAHMA